MPPPQAPVRQPRPSQLRLTALLLRSAWQSVLAPAPLQLTPVPWRLPLMVTLVYTVLAIIRPRKAFQAPQCGVLLLPTNACSNTTGTTPEVQLLRHVSLSF